MATPQVVTITQDAIEYPIQKVSWDWLCTDLGVVSSAASGWYCGKIVRAIISPDSSTTQPTDAYDVTIEDADGFDILSGEGANASNAAAVHITDPTKTLWVRSGVLTLKIASAGDAKGGVVTLYILRA